MDEKLFNVEPETREVNFFLHAYKGNRIIGKILKTLIENETFKVTDSTDPKTDENKIYKISANSALDYYIIKGELLMEIELMLPELFPANYQFNFTENNLGFVNSFEVYNGQEGEEKLYFRVAHRIKEIRTDGRSNVPQKQIIK